MAHDFKSLVVEDCRANPGTQGKAFVIPIRGVANEPKTKYDLGVAAATTQNPYNAAPGDKVAYGQPFTYKSNADYWRSFDIVFDSGQLDFDTAGDRGFESITTMFECMIKGTGDAQREFAEALIECNGCGGWMIGIATRDEPTKLAVLGTISNGGNAKIKGSLGKKSGDKNVMETKFEFDTGLTWRSYDLVGLGVRTAPIS